MVLSGAYLHDRRAKHSYLIPYARYVVLKRYITYAYYMLSMVCTRMQARPTYVGCTPLVGCFRQRRHHTYTIHHTPYTHHIPYTTPSYHYVYARVRHADADLRCSDSDRTRAGRAIAPFDRAPCSRRSTAARVHARAHGGFHDGCLRGVEDIRRWTRPYGR